MYQNSSTFRILIATDIHLGFLENDAIRGNDTINTFEEILQIAKYEDVDFMLLGGDLFHENKPSRKIICQAIYLIRKYCFGKKTQKFQVLNLPDFNESDKTLPKFNIKDPNLNISIPLFSIHGNHDDPIGMEGLCSLDIFSNAGLVNYFGKIQSSEKISIKPVMFRKGDSNLSIYGLGSLKDSRLQKMFKANLVQAEPPPISDTESFNIFVLHQNRYKHNEESYIPEDILFEFLDLVFWGHEHECLIDPIQVKNKGYFLTQPGSSVITSLSKGESVTKHVGILSICNKSFKIDKIPLKTVRPLLFKNIKLDDDLLSVYDVNKLTRTAHDHIQTMIENHLIKSDNDMLPLIRLKITHTSDIKNFKIKPFGKEYVGRVANTHNIILFKKVKKNNHQNKENDSEFAFKKDIKMEDFLSGYFDKNENLLKLEILPRKLIFDCVSNFVSKNDKDSISFFIDSYLRDLLNSVCLTSEETIDENITKAADIFMSKAYIPTPKHDLNLLIEKENTPLKRTKVARKRGPPTKK